MKNVLVVDDVSMNRKIVKSILLQSVEDIAVIEAENAFVAMDELKRGGISIVILDIMMPVKDGIELLTEIKAEAELKNIPVIMCSALHELDMIQKTLNLGALDYFTKPLTEEQMKITLPLKVRNALEYYEQQSEILKYYDNLRREMRLAGNIQKAMISEYSKLTESEMYGKYIPCQEIGGDFFSSKQVNGNMWFMMADVSGHGIAAAMISSMLNVVFSTSIAYCGAPGDVLKSINERLCEIFMGTDYGLVSAFVGCIRGETFQYANAGHPYPVFFQKKTHTIEELKIDGFLLGMFKEEGYDTQTKVIEEGDTIILYTDGLFDKGEEEGCVNWVLVSDYCNRNKDKLLEPLTNFLENIIDYFENRENRVFIDDVAIMAIKKI